MADRVVIYILDRAGNPVGILDQATKFAATSRWQDLGSVMATARTTNPGADVLVRGSSLAVVIDGAVFASGPIKQFVTDRDDKGEFVEASGPDDLTWLEGSIGYPVAPSIDPNAAASMDVSGSAEDVIYSYVDANVGPSAAATARQRVRVGVSGHRGSTVNESVRFDGIMTVANRVALVDGLGLSCRWDPVAHGLPLFEVEVSRDLRAEIQFSVERGTIAKSKVTDIAPSATDILVGGSGTGVGRVFAQVVDPVQRAAWYRVETFVDAGDVSDPVTLQQRAEASLQQSGRIIELEAIETEGMRYGDWLVGDIVTGVASGVADVFVVVQVAVAGPPLRFTPTLAQFAGYRLGQLQAVQQRVLAARVRSLETA